MSISLRDKRKQETREQLIAVATRLFVFDGYKAVSAQALCEEARVTRGALYHHFPAGKPDLFEAVFFSQQNSLYEIVRDAGEPGSDDRVIHYLVGASKDEYRRIVWEDGPNVLGWDRWRRIERDHWMDLIADSGFFAELDEFKTKLLGAIIFGAIGELVALIAEADDVHAAAVEASGTLRAMLNGILDQKSKSDPT